MSRSERGIWSSLDADSVSNVLFLSPQFSQNSDHACLALQSVTEFAKQRLLAVTFVQPPDETISRWRTHGGWPPAAYSVIRIGEPTRANGSTDQVDPNVVLVNNPSDLTGIGIAINRTFADATDQDGRVVMCFDSLTALLQYAEVSRVFRFLHVITQRGKSAGAVAHYHMDPGAHDDKEVNTIRSLFDAIVELDESGDISITHG